MLSSSGLDFIIFPFLKLEKELVPEMILSFSGLWV
jgi:hypothetical protein